MKKVLLVLLLLLVAFVAVNRLRIFLWDPLATVTRDGAKQAGIRVLINYPSDLLLQDGSGTPKRVYLVQHWDKTLKTPSARLTCLRLLGCMTDRDQASGIPVRAGSRGRRSPFEGVTMTDRRAKFVDEDGALVEVVLW